MAPVVIWFCRALDGVQTAVCRRAFVGLISFGTFVLTPIVGWLGDRTSKPQLSAVCMAFGAVSMAMLLHQSGEIWYLVLSVLLLAVAESANPLNWAIMGDFFGRRAFATLRLATSARPAHVHEHAGMDGMDLRPHRELLLVLLPLAIIYGLSACVLALTSPSHQLDLIADQGCLVSISSACLRVVSVISLPPDIRAISSMRSAKLSGWMSVVV